MPADASPAQGGQSQKLAIAPDRSGRFALFGHLIWYEVARGSCLSRTAAFIFPDSGDVEALRTFFPHSNGTFVLVPRRHVVHLFYTLFRVVRVVIIAG